jgi:hypothetical protein
MKAAPLVLFLVLPLSLSANDVSPGDSIEMVRSSLGTPRGQVRVGDRVTLFFDRGEVVLQSGCVDRTALRSVEEQSALEAKRIADAARIREEMDIRRARLSVEGEAIRVRKLADPTFLAMPLAYQVAFWEDFSRRYAEVPVAEQLTSVRIRLAEQLSNERRARADDSRLAELETRVAAAEAAASANDGGVRFGAYYSSIGGLRSRHGTIPWIIDYGNVDMSRPWALYTGTPAVPQIRRSNASSASLCRPATGPNNDQRDDSGSRRTRGYSGSRGF